MPNGDLHTGKTHGKTSLKLFHFKDLSKKAKLKAKVNKMATTYLTLTNDILRELNEIELTSATFASAKGIQSFVKECY